jgi:hypothetical protein
VGIIHNLWKQGVDFMEDVCVQELTEEQAFEVECFLISKFGRVSNGTGILANLTKST